jgi:lipopolysaccharide transport system permease protein
LALDADATPADRHAVQAHGDADELPETVIESLSGWALVDWRELAAYRDMFRFLTLRSIRVRYAQSSLGIGWAVVQPLVSMVIFTIIFGRMVGIDSDGVPYALFSFVALVPWTYFANALSDATASLITNANMLSKVYFPRLILPLSAVASKLVDFAIAMGMLAILMTVHRQAPGPGIVALPLLILLMVTAATGLGLWLTATAVQYRDVSYAMSFIVQVLMYVSPVVYSVDLVPERFRLLYALNPMVGVIEGFRAALLGTTPMPWGLIAIGALSAAALLLSGMLYFRRMEQYFADVA